jgi:hypothetical protein
MTSLGFLLMHMVVYLGLISLVTLFTVHLMAIITLHRATVSTQRNTPLLIMAAYALLARDIREAQEPFDTWDHTGTTWQWKSCNGLITWRLEDSRLIRSQECIINGVREQRQALIVDGIVSYTLQSRMPRLIQIDLVPQAKQFPAAVLHRSVAICNGFLS